MIAIGVPAESAEEPRIGLSPETAKKLVKLGAKVSVRSGAGLRSHFSDEEYKAAGADIVATDADAVKDADIVLTVRRPPLALAKSMNALRASSTDSSPVRTASHVSSAAACKYPRREVVHSVRNLWISSSDPIWHRKPRPTTTATGVSNRVFFIMSATCWQNDSVEAENLGHLSAQKILRSSIPSFG